MKLTFYVEKNIVYHWYMLKIIIASVWMNLFIIKIIEVFDKMICNNNDKIIFINYKDNKCICENLLYIL